MTTPLHDWVLNWMQTLPQNFDWAITGDEAVRIGHRFVFIEPLEHDNDNERPKHTA